jgi:hypothetical protein
MVDPSIESINDVRTKSKVTGFSFLCQLLSSGHRKIEKPELFEPPKYTRISAIGLTSTSFIRSKTIQRPMS